MNWSDLIVPAVGTAIGAAGAYFALDKRQAVSEARLSVQLDALKEATGTALVDIKTEHMRSAAGQGTRLEKLGKDVETLMDFKARTEGAAEKERDLSGVVRNR